MLSSGFRLCRARRLLRRNELGCIVPVLYDILFKKPPLNVDVGSDDDLDDIPDDAAEFIAAQKSAGTAQPEA